VAAALAIGMDEYLACPSIVARPVGVVKTLATVQPGDAYRMERVREIGGADLLEGSRPGAERFVRRLRTGDDVLTFRL
jgi:hypothetical protein